MVLVGFQVRVRFVFFSVILFVSLCFRLFVFLSFFYSVVFAFFELLVLGGSLVFWMFGLLFLALCLLSRLVMFFFFTCSVEAFSYYSLFTVLRLMFTGVFVVVLCFFDFSCVFPFSFLHNLFFLCLFLFQSLSSCFFFALFFCVSSRVPCSFFLSLFFCHDSVFSCFFLPLLSNEAGRGVAPELEAFKMTQLCAFDCRGEGGKSGVMR